MTLYEYLVDRGRHPDDADRAALAYNAAGIDAAVAAITWMDDDEHCYSAEMRGCIERWEQSLELPGARSSPAGPGFEQHDTPPQIGLPG